MVKIRNFLNVLIPPEILSIHRQSKKLKTGEEMWSGDYSSWAEAQIKCTGYDSEVILEKCKNALLKVKNGEAIYERDSVLFNEIQYSWGLLAGLLRAALRNDGELCVLDFGGSLGSTYYQNKEFLKPLKELKWCIIEQSHFVDCGKKLFEGDQLKFFNTIEECITHYRPNVLLLSGVLQYLEKPYEWIEKFVGLGLPNIIIDRTSFVENERDILTIQNVPESIYLASYPAWFLNKERFSKFFATEYCLVSEFADTIDPPIKLNGLNASWGGLYFIKR